jgi:hypothetical protein
MVAEAGAVKSLFDAVNVSDVYTRDLKTTMVQRRQHKARSMSDGERSDTGSIGGGDSDSGRKGKKKKRKHKKQKGGSGRNESVRCATIAITRHFVLLSERVHESLTLYHCAM